MVIGVLDSDYYYAIVYFAKTDLILLPHIIGAKIQIKNENFQKCF